VFEIRHFKVKERLVLELNKIELENLNKEKKDQIILLIVLRSIMKNILKSKT
jgi:hypothetical protein